MAETTGASFAAVTVKTAASLSESTLGSEAVKVIDSAPFQLASGIVIVATRAVMSTVNSALPA